MTRSTHHLTLAVSRCVYALVALISSLLREVIFPWLDVRIMSSIRRLTLSLLAVLTANCSLI